MIKKRNSQTMHEQQFIYTVKKSICRQVPNKQTQILTTPITRHHAIKKVQFAQPVELSTNQVSKLYDLKKRYLKVTKEQRSVSQRQSQQPIKYSPKENVHPKPPAPPTNLRSNLRNILKANFQQAIYEENPENENIRNEFSQLQEIPVDLQDWSYYQIVKNLGAGASAEVKMARHKIMQIDVAIKIYDKKKLNQQALKNLTREVEILLKLRHPNIIRLYHFLDSEKLIYLIMEYSSPTSLDCLMKGRPFKRMNEDEAKIIFRQIVQAVAYLHEQGVIHRDLKLENLLVDSQTKKIQLIDFGYSIIYDPQSKPSVSCGTPSYMSPELVKKTSYDFAVDVWACGIILYKILTGIFPFRGNSEKDLSKKIIIGKIEYPSFVSFQAKQLINSMLKADRATIMEVIQNPWFN